MLLLAMLLGAPSLRAEPRVQVAVEGISGEIRSTVLANLSIERERDHPLLNDARIERLHQRAPEEIKNALRPFGYYSPEISSGIRREGEVWLARYVVRPGSPVRISRIELAIDGPGADDPAFTKWRTTFPLTDGDILLDRLYEEAKDTLMRLGRERGYLYGYLAEHEVRVNARELTAEIRIRYFTGDRMRFGPINFSLEKVPLRESLLTRYPAFAEGEPYDAEKIYQLHRDLANSDYFEQVNVMPRVESPIDNEIPVDVGLEMRRRDRYTVGIGYGTDTGPRASLGFDRRWVNAYGHRFNSEAVISDVRKGVAGTYRIPLTRPNTDYLGFTGSRERENTTTSVRDTSAVSMNVTHDIDKWQRTVSLNYQEENYEVAGAISRATMLFPGIALQRIETDDRFFPTHGWRILADARIAAEPYYSSTSLVQGRLSGKMVIPLLGGRLMPRFDVAGSAVSNFDKLPVSLRYFAGGDQSVRGFAYQSLGPTDANGNVIGGTDLLVGSVEYDHYVSPRFGLAAFTDMGNAFTSFGHYRLHQGAGAGVRWRFPFGVVRFDAAWAVSEPRKPWRLHLTIGPDL